MSLLRKTNTSGFTLLEVLLALALMVMLGLSGYLILDGIARAQQQQQETTRQLRIFQRSVTIMDRDFQHIVPRTSHDERLTYPMLSIMPPWIQSESGSVSFIRGGWSNPSLQFSRSNMQLVAYRVKNATLEKISWNTLDTDRQTAPHTITPLFKEVKTFTVEVFTNERWQKIWRSPQKLPEALRITIEFDDSSSDHTQLQRVYHVR